MAQIVHRLHQITFLSVLVVFFSCPVSAESIVVSEDGSVSLRLRSGTPKTEAVVFKFGLPGAPTRAWREGDVLRTTWITNGVRYTQTALLSSVSLAPNGSNLLRDTPVLMVNIEGENITNEYAEAWVTLSVETASKPLETALKDGFVWRLHGESNSLVCALEIPESGIKSTQGQTLRFSGNIPPSLKGSMTLKIPLEAISSEPGVELLRTVDFDSELQRALKKITRPTTADLNLRFNR